jgi:beta-lactamase regulating signal transducer with metallopeptidase domain
MMPILLEAAFRSLLMAVAVWAGIRLFRVQAVLAQKIAWALVLVASIVMPIAMRASWLVLDQAIRIPVRHAASSAKIAPIKLVPALYSPASVRAEDAGRQHSAPAAKPSSAHLRSFASRTASATQTPETASALQAIPSAQAGPAPPLALQVSSENSGHFAFWTWAQIELALIAVYFAIAAILLIRTCAGLLLAYRIWRRSTPFAGAFAADASRIRVSADLSTPVTIGSTVILPANCANWDESKLRVVLAHEQSHVRQGDFFLQLLAAIHAAVFWFSPLGWWLQRKISELGEALSDRAGLEQATDAASYARILLEFAAMPRTSPFAGALTGVAMARSSNLSSRIERVLNARLFRVAFQGSRRHAFLAAVLAPAALVAAVACVRIVPAVEAAQAQTNLVGPSQSAGQSSSHGTSGDAKVAASGLSGQVSGDMPDQVTSVETGQAPDLVSPFPPAAPQIQTPPQVQEPAPPLPPPAPGKTFFYSSSEDSDEPFAIVRSNDSNVLFSGTSGQGLENAKKKYHSNFIWFERDGKSYVITDPALLAQGEALFKGDPSFKLRKEDLDRLQARLNLEMAKLQPEIDKAKLPGPEFAEKMAKLEAELSALQSDKYIEMAKQISKEISEKKVLTDEQIKEITDAKLGDLQKKIDAIQARLGDIQGELGEREGLLSEKQAEAAEKLGKLGEEMGKIGEEQGQTAEEASRKLKSILDQAVKDGKAKPVE